MIDGIKTTNPLFSGLISEQDIANGVYDIHWLENKRFWSRHRELRSLYSVHLGGAFFGESMFSVERDTSKIALIFLAARLIVGGFLLLDTQFVTDHLRQFGTVEVARDQFQVLLDSALDREADFHALDDGINGRETRPECGRPDKN